MGLMGASVVDLLSGKDFSFVPRWGESATHLNLCIGSFSYSIMCHHFGSREGQGKLKVKINDIIWSV